MAKILINSIHPWQVHMHNHNTTSSTKTLTKQVFLSKLMQEVSELPRTQQLQSEPVRAAPPLTCLVESLATLSEFISN